MKYPYVNSAFLRLIFTLSMIYYPLSATAAIVRTEVIFYDLATTNQRSYTFGMIPTSGGAQVTLHRNDDKFSLSTEIATCFDTRASAEPEGYLWLKKRDTHHSDPALLSFLNFTQDNRLRVAMKPMANAQSLLLDKDSLTVLVVDPTMMTLGTTGCQR